MIKEFQLLESYGWSTCPYGDVTDLFSYFLSRDEQNFPSIKVRVYHDIDGQEVLPLCEARDLYPHSFCTQERRETNTIIIVGDNIFHNLCNQPKPIPQLYHFFQIFLDENVIFRIQENPSLDPLSFPLESIYNLLK